MLQMKQEFDAQLFGIRNGLRGQLRLGIQRRRAPYFLTPVLARFKKEYPEVQVIIKDCIAASLLQLFENGEIDLLICTKDSELPNCEEHLIYKERLLVMLPADHPACMTARKLPGQPFPILNLKELDGELFLLQTEQQSLRHDCDRALARYGVIPGNIQVISNIEFCVQLVAAGMGVGFNREGYIKYIHADKPVRYFTFESHPRFTPFVVAHEKGKLLPDYTQRMITMLLEQGKNVISTSDFPNE